MKIALVHKRLDLKGGTERDLYLTAEGLRDLGHEVHLFCGEFAVQVPAGVIAHRVPVIPFGRTARLWSFAFNGSRTAASANCDVTVGFGRILKQDVLRCGGGSHRNFLQQLGAEGGWRRRAWQKLSIYHQGVLRVERRQFSVDGFQEIIAVSGKVKDDLIRTYSIPEHRIRVIYNGVDPVLFTPDRREKARVVIRDQWGIPRAAPVVLFIGSGFQRKGLDRMLSIWQSQRLHKTWLLVVGDDAGMNRYKKIAETAGQGRIIFTGRQPDVESYYAAADLMALPAVQEAFGNVVLEALSSGLPDLVSSEVGAAEVLSGALLQGIVDKPDDPVELEAKMVALLEHAAEPELIKEATTLAARFSWDNHFRQLEDLFFAVVSSRLGVRANVA
ncbi:MAG TPA: glycosyltransferase family 4 protein [Candidatus Binatia bacterium]